MRDGAPFKGWALPEAIGAVQQKLMVKGGDRQIVAILSAVATDSFCAEALRTGLASRDVVLIALARREQSPPPQKHRDPDALTLSELPRADCERYDQFAAYPRHQVPRERAQLLLPNPTAGQQHLRCILLRAYD